MITAEGLTRKYGEFTAVNNVSFSIPRGQVVGLLGHNGAGKTTIMKMLTGYLEPTQGRAIIAGLDVVEHRLEVQEKIGYLPEISPLYPDMSVLEYLEYVCALRALPEGEWVPSIREAVDRTGLRQAARKRISTLSKGYKQRLGVAQAIIHKPEILVLDEPTSGLDPSQIHEMRELLRGLSTHSTVVISTHILQEVEAMCDRVIIILSGKVAVDAKLDELRASGRIVLEVDRGAQEVCNTLGSFAGVAKVTADEVSDGQHRYVVQTDGAPAAVLPGLARKVVEQGWQLFRIGEERRTLEAVFREINAGGVNGR